MKPKLISDKVTQAYLIKESSEDICLKNKWISSFYNMAKIEDPHIDKFDDHEFLPILHDLLPLAQRGLIQTEWKEDEQGRFLILKIG